MAAGSGERSGEPARGEPTRAPSGAARPDEVERARASSEPARGARKYVYRREPTPSGVEKMRRGDLNHFDLEVFANFNTGVLEEYLETKNRVEGFRISRWSWKKVLVGVAIGCVFALINVYVGLKIGLIVYGAWYVAYLVGMGLRWRASEINLMAGAANGTSFIVTGFVYVFPAIYLLSSYNTGQYSVLIAKSAIPSLGVAIVATVIAGLLGVMYFIIFRRIWLIDDPLPYPSFESFIKLLDMTHDITAGAAERARHSVRLVLTFTGISGAFAFLRDFPLIRPRAGAEPVPVMDNALGAGGYYAGGQLQLPLATAQYTWLNLTLSPLLLATGWFMRLRAAFVVACGTLFVWFVAIPLAVVLNVPVFVPSQSGEIGLAALAAAGQPSAVFAFGGAIRTMAAGAILGGGLTALFKMTPTMKGVIKDLFRLRGESDASAGPYVAGRGWYEWPPAHILVMLVITLLALPALFVYAGYPVLPSIVFAVVMVATSFFLGAIACKVLGETSIEPVSGTSFIVFLLLFGVFTALHLPTGTTVAMGLLGTTVYASSIAMTGDILLDFKNALYVGNTPYHQLKAEITGIIPGAICGVLAASLLSIGLAQGKINLAAPQGNAFATLVSAIAGGHVDYTVFVLGLAFGVLVEVLTGMGTAFGLGMFFPLGLGLALLAGGAARDIWEKRYLDRQAALHGWDDEKKTIKLLDSYMVATGLIVGEAVVGTVIAIYLAAGLLVS
ncbi:MAG: OPT/YSL family transporter [Thermoplasmatota archaeon]